MATYYAKRALEILREDGVIALIKTVLNCFYRYRRVRVPQLIGKFKYRSSYPDPDKIIYINLTDIKYGILSNSLSNPGTYIIDGDWDKNINKNTDKIPYYSDRAAYKEIIRKNPWQLYPLEKWDHYNSFVEHFNKNVAWEDTEFYTQLIDDTGRNSNKYTGSESIKNRFRYNDELFYSIKNNGFLTNQQLQNQKDTSFQKHPHGEIGVGITRNGDFVWVRNGALHRFTIAKILQIQSVPVKVKLRHKKWQELRDEIHNNGLPEGCEDLRDHPDLQDVLN